MHGQFTWYELTTPDVDGAITYHREVFGWDPTGDPRALDAGVRVFVDAGDAASWLPILRGPVASEPAGEDVARPQLAGAGVRRCVDATGAAFYLSRPSTPAPQRHPSAHPM